MPVLDWVGKDKVVSHYKNLPVHSLKEVKEASFNSTKNENMFIEGDNLLALKALLPRYKGKIKCIYIDPPYNTGKEGWKYNDNVNDPRLKLWFNEVVGKETEDLNRHDKWLSMIYPRLLLAKEFLTEDGIIFVSIDDNSIQYLKILMDEIFGRRNLLSNFIWKSDGNFDNQAKVKVCHEYILSYCKNYSLFPHPKVIDPNVLNNKKSKLHKSEIRNTIVKNGPKNPISEILLPAGFPCEVEELIISKRDNAWPHYDKDLIIENYKLVNSVVAKSGWSSKKILLKYIDNNFEAVLDSKKQNTEYIITQTGNIDGIKDRKKHAQSHVISVLQDLGSTQSTSNKLKEQNMSFDYPKPTELLQYLISMVDGNDFIVLDFFAGSGSTAEAVIELNLLDKGSRKFILVEWDEHSLFNIALQRVKNKINQNKELNKLRYGYFRISDPIVDKFKRVLPNLKLKELTDYIYFLEFLNSKSDLDTDNYFIGEYEGNKLYLLHPESEYFDSNKVLSLSNELLKTFAEGPKIIYGNSSSINSKKLKELNITFKQIPYDL